MPLQLFDNILRWQGFPIQEAKSRFKQLLNSTDESIDQSKKAIVQHHLKHNNFYKNLLDNKSTDWAKLPVLTKRDLQQPLHERLSNDYSSKNVFKGKTSGSSGHPFTYAKDKFAHAITWAAFHHAYNEHDIDLNTSLQARFYGIPLSGKGKYVELLKDYVSNRKRFPIFNLNNVMLEKYVSRFRESEYEYLNGYTSSIVLLAKYCREKGTTLKTYCPSLKICIVTSEMLFADDRKLLEKWIGIPVVNEYGASEVGLMAMENPQGEFVLNQQNLFIEIVDDTNQPVTDGTIGRILVTDLYNLAHPMIRYEIGDLGSLKTLENGTRILENLQGRTSDIARLPSGKVVPGLTFYYVTKSIINEDVNILEFIVIQKTEASFEIQYVSSQEMNGSQKAKVQKAMDEYLEPDLAVAFTRLDSLDRSNRGKLKQFICEVDR
ncbi:phenylacetate--CoA ligase family protein [Nonlabens mediterrranea]|uniref:Phenylacetate--CoA ligase family protein n=1 Tax=Nonlabens mediterrranea TaxID=1419947 RepID=A0ABS0A351_9FLAO|nr:phenylacetate--CoA ligase family protein [Nonlabens mediterrranea]